MNLKSNQVKNEVGKKFYFYDPNCGGIIANDIKIYNFTFCLTIY